MVFKLSTAHAINSMTNRIQEVDPISQLLAWTCEYCETLNRDKDRCIECGAPEILPPTRRFK